MSDECMRAQTRRTSLVRRENDDESRQKKKKNAGLVRRDGLGLSTFTTPARDPRATGAGARRTASSGESSRDTRGELIPMRSCRTSLWFAGVPRNLVPTPSICP